MQYDIPRCERVLAVKGWTKTILSEKTGLSNAVITKFFSGKSVRNDTARTIITKLGLPMEEVLLPEPAAADVPMPLTSQAERELLASAKSRRA